MGTSACGLRDPAAVSRLSLAVSPASTTWPAARLARVMRRPEPAPESIAAFRRTLTTQHKYLMTRIRDKSKSEMVTSYLVHMRRTLWAQGIAHGPIGSRRVAFSSMCVSMAEMTTPQWSRVAMHCMVRSVGASGNAHLREQSHVRDTRLKRPETHARCTEPSRAVDSITAARSAVASLRRGQELSRRWLNQARSDQHGAGPSSLIAICFMKARARYSGATSSRVRVGAQK